MAAVRVVIGLVLTLAILDASAPEREYVPMAPPPEPVAAASGGLRPGWYLVDRIVDGQSVTLHGVEQEVRLAGVTANSPELDGQAGQTSGLPRLIQPGDPVFAEPAESGPPYAYLRVPRDDDLWTLQELLLQSGAVSLAREGPLVTRRYHGAFAEAERVGRRRA